MDTMKLLRGDVPAWYELGIEDDTNLLIRVHPYAVEGMREIFKVSQAVIGAIRHDLPIPPFIDLAREWWGFGKVLHRIANKGTWAQWVCPLPKKASGPLLTETEMHAALAVSASLQVLFWGLQCPDENGDTRHDSPQLFSIWGMNSRKDADGGAISIVMAPAVSHWVSQLANPREVRALVAQAMYKAWFHMRGRRGYEEYDFKVLFRDQKWIHLSCPGSGCGLDPEEHSMFELGGYRLQSHNVDSPFQQLTLLMGLAALHQSIHPLT